jgi:hypothetical protein
LADKMDLKNINRIRVENCIGTIIDVHKTIGTEYKNQELIAQFEELNLAVENMDMGMVCEVDIIMVEQATNALLGELREDFEIGKFGPVYDEKQN